ncbi:hypothetical protein ACHAPJ_000311 [Fusarium lateritium]
MAEPPPPGEGRGRSSHVRWGRVEEYYPDPPQPRRYERIHPIRRSTNERVDLPIERPHLRNDGGPVAKTWQQRSRDDVPVPIYRETYQRRSRDEAPVQEYTEWITTGEQRPQTLPGPDREYTESPRPIEDAENEREESRQRRFSYDRGDYGRARSRSRSPGYSRYESPRRDRYRSRETSSRTFGGDSEWYSRRRGSFSSNDYDPYDKFDFSSQAQSITESSKTEDSDVDSPESEERAIFAKDERGNHTRSQLTLVHSSLYTGNAELGGSHTATLNVVHDPKGQKHPLFRWLHVPQDVMNFDEFWVEITRISGLTELEKKAITRLRADVKKTCVKSRVNPKGAKVGYLEPKCIEVPLKSLKQETTTPEAINGSARWICIPYFSLEQYSGLLAAASTSLFPAQTLLQVQYSRNTVSRDMEQAVVQLGNANRGECFHISQLWCLVIDNSLIVTCGTMPREDLLGQSLEVKEQPSRILATERKGRILVAYGDSVVWSLEAEECQTWFAFLSKFQEFWPKIPEFWHKDQAVTAEAWPRILKLASDIRSMSVKITMKLGSHPPPPPRAILRSEPHALPTTHDGKGKPKIDGFTHILALTKGGLRGSYAHETGFKPLEAQLDAAERFLTSETTYSDRKAYKFCKTATRKECYDYLAGLADGVEDDGSDDVRRAYEEKIDIFNAADVIYTSFLPMDFTCSMADKFWGAVRTIIELSILDGPFIRTTFENTVSDLRTCLRNFSRDHIALQSIVTYSSKEERSGIELPPEFTKAWLYVTMGMIYGSKDDEKWENRITRADELVEKGSKKLLQELCGKNLLDKAAVLPLEVLSLVTLGLLQDQVGKSDDICDTYSQYLNSLDNAITSKPSDRSFQHQLDLVQQELVAVKRTLWKQKALICRVRKSLTDIDTRDIVMRQYDHDMLVKDTEMRLHQAETALAAAPPPPSYRPDEDYTRIAPVTYTQEVAPANDYMGLDDDFLFDMATSSKLSPTDAGGLRGLFFLDCSRLIEQREFEFRRFTDFSKDLERAIAYKMDFTRDRQERAIYAFTLVTIIFLPISTVSSIFGMNTTDVRDMEYSQWLYWVVAIPLTIVVIIIGLWFMGELGNLVQWLLRRPGNGVQGVYGGPTMLPQTYESTHWAPTPAAQPTTQVAEYSSPFEPGHGMRRRVQAQAYYPTPQARVYRSRTLEAGGYR